MKKTIFFILSIMLCISVMAQQNIQLRSVDKAECVKSDMTSLKASFSFSTIEAQDYPSERGTFSWLSLANTVIGGNVGDPQIPVVNELIAVPFGATPRIEITSYSTTDYRLEDYSIHTLVPRQPSLRKDKRPEDVPFVYNEAAYQTRGMRSEPQAVVDVVGIMRGVQLGKMTIEPVSYDPVNNTLRVFNDIEVTVYFDGADARATEEMLVKTYSPYFDIVYKSLFNGRAVTSVYDDHPDLYTTPVKMLVVTTSTYANSTPFQNWLTWKKQKGIDVDVQTVANSASASTIRTLIQNRYNANHPTFLVIVGDETVVTNYSMWDYESSYGNAATDLEYASVDGDIYHDMFMSRMPVASTTQLGNLVDKILMYEKYEMPDPSYLNETLLIAGWDEPQTYHGYTYPSWTNIAGKPTIQYANNNYFNSAHGITPHVFITTGSGQTTCYNYINNVGFINYTAHGDIQMWYDPNFTNTNVNNLTNTNKPFWAMGNCCLTANLKNAQNNQTCFGETMVRAANKGAFGYIGSMVESYWYEDFYFGVGAFNASYSTNNNPTVSGTSKGAYDALFDETSFNSLNAVPYIGNISVSYAYAQNYENSEITPEYYWRCYQCFGDGSVMPYVKQPAANNVSHATALPIGDTTFTVSADAGSYVSITVNNEIIGVAQVSSSGMVNVPITPQSMPGTALVVVTRNQRQPYIQTINIVGGTQYDITCNPVEHGSISAPAQAYAQSMVTLTATPDTGYCLASWNVVDGNNNPVAVTGNTFIMPESNVTVSATFVLGHTVSLASVMNGSISADPTCALQGTIINLTATPASGYNFEGWRVYKTADVNTAVTVTDNSFTMPDYDVTVSAIFLAPQGGDVHVGSGTGTTAGADLPTDVYYKYCLSQQIYTSAEVGDAATITAISFYYNSSISSGNRTLDIYMAHTTKSTLTSWVTESTSHMVFSGSHNFTEGWNTITLTTPFAYNGTSNLLLTVDDNTGTYYNISQFIYFYTYSTGANRAIYYRNDYNNPSATNNNSNNATKVKYNSQIIFTKVTPSTESYLSVSTDNLSGFSYAEGEGPSDAQSLALIGANLQGNLTVTMPTGYEASSDGSNYSTTLSLTPSNGNLQQMFYVRLTSGLGQGSYNGTMTLVSGNTTQNITLSGEVTESATQTFTKEITASTETGGYYLLASPIGEVNPENVTNMLSNNYDLYHFDQTQEQEWINYEADTFNLIPGKGYLYANSDTVTLTFTGYPYTGTAQLPLTKNDGNHFTGWNLVGNPFAQTAYVDRDFYVMNGQGTEIVAADRDSVAIMEGIFVVAENDGDTVTFSTSVPSNIAAALVMNVTCDDGVSIDRAIIRFGEESNLPKHMLDPNHTKLYIPQDGKDYAVVTAQATGELPLNFKASKNGEYTLSFDLDNVEFDYLHLIDNLTGTDIDLLERFPLANRRFDGVKGSEGDSQPATYTFTAKTTDNPSRFKVVYVTVK